MQNFEKSQYCSQKNQNVFRFAYHYMYSSIRNWNFRILIGYITGRVTKFFQPFQPWTGLIMNPSLLATLHQRLKFT